MALRGLGGQVRVGSDWIGSAPRPRASSGALRSARYVLSGRRGLAVARPRLLFLQERFGEPRSGAWAFPGPGPTRLEVGQVVVGCSGAGPEATSSAEGSACWPPACTVSGLVTWCWRAGPRPGKGSPLSSYGCSFYRLALRGLGNECPVLLVKVILPKAYLNEK